MALQEFQKDYKPVAAGQTDAALGPGSTTGVLTSNNRGEADVLERITVIPATTSPGAISIKDGSNGSSVTVFTGGATSVADLKPFTIELGIRAKGDATHAPRWLITTGANVSIVAKGRFL